MVSQSGFSSLLALMGRLCLAMIFLVAGAHKLMDFPGTVAYITSEGLPFATVLAAVAAGIELLGGLAVLLGYRTRFGAFILFLLIIPTTLISHDFWTEETVGAMNHIQHFMKNFAIMGGMLMLMALGPGEISVDGRCVGNVA